MKNLLITIILFVFSFSLTAQKEANYWFFGEFAGLDFSNGSPVAITNGALSTMEGCSSISSPTGTLQFYTDGIKVWNRNNQQMPNGYGLLGDPSSTQSGIIVPKPGSTNLYYIFTVDDVGNGNGGTNGLNYTLVDMTLDGFKGDVVTTQKNVLLTKPLCEKVTAVGHSNGIDIWVISHKWGTDSFYSYLVTEGGVTQDPIISSSGTVISGEDNNAKGYMKVSPDGEKLAKANAGLKTVEIFDFDNTTGVVSNGFLDYITVTDPYGIEFSPNSSRLYVNSWYVGANVLYQYNLEAGTPQSIIDSRVQITTGTEGSLQLGPDNRIYVAQNQSSYLSVINAPNELGNDCAFQWAAVSLSGKNSRWGLPPFIQSFFSFNAGYYNTSPCFGTPTQFHQNSSQEPDSVLWNFGNPASGSANTSTEFDPVHTFTSPGFFPVMLKVWITGVEAVVTHIVIVNEIPDVQLPPDTSMCEGNYFTIDAGDGFSHYQWQTGDTTQVITVSTSGEYWVEVTTEFGCSNRDTIQVEFYPNPVVFAGENQTIIAGASTTLEGEISSGSGDYSIEWQPANWLEQNDILNPTTLNLNDPTVFTLYALDSRGCEATPDEVLVNIEGAFLSVFPIAEPNEMCGGISTHISANATGGGGVYNYSWTSDSPGFSSNEAEFDIIPEVGTTNYYLTVTDQYDNSISGSVDVVVYQLPEANLIPQGATIYGEDTIIVCVRDAVLLDAGNNSDPEGTTYYWTDQLLLDRYYTASTNGAWIDIQSYEVVVTHGGSECENAGNITIIFDFNECGIGIEDNPIDESQIIKLYPNPNDGSFNFELLLNTNKLMLNVYDISGQLVYEHVQNGNISAGEKFNIASDIPPGLYVVKVVVDNRISMLKMFVR